MKYLFVFSFWLFLKKSRHSSSDTLLSKVNLRFLYRLLTLEEFRLLTLSVITYENFQLERSSIFVVTLIVRWGVVCDRDVGVTGLGSEGWLTGMVDCIVWRAVDCGRDVVVPGLGNMGWLTSGTDWFRRLMRAFWEILRRWWWTFDGWNLMRWGLLFNLGIEAR